VLQQQLLLLLPQLQVVLLLLLLLPAKYVATFENLLSRVVALPALL